MTTGSAIQASHRVELGGVSHPLSLSDWGLLIVLLATQSCWPRRGNLLSAVMYH